LGSIAALAPFFRALMPRLMLPWNTAMAAARSCLPHLSSLEKNKELKVDHILSLGIVAKLNLVKVFYTRYLTNERMASDAGKE